MMPATTTPDRRSMPPQGSRHLPVALATTALSLLLVLTPIATARLGGPDAPTDPIDPTPEMGAEVVGVNATTAPGYTATADVLVWFECQDPAHYTGPYQVELSLEASTDQVTVPEATRTLAVEFSETECKTEPARHQRRLPVEMVLAPEVTAYTEIPVSYVLAPTDGGPRTEGTLDVTVPRIGAYSITPDTTYREKGERIPVYLSVHNTFNAPLTVEISLMGEPNLGTVETPGNRTLRPVQLSDGTEPDLFVVWYEIDERGLDSFSIRLRAAVLGPDGDTRDTLLEDVYEVRIDTENRSIQASQLEPIDQRPAPGPGPLALMGAALLGALMWQDRRRRGEA